MFGNEIDYSYLAKLAILIIGVCIFAYYRTSIMLWNAARASGVKISIGTIVGYKRAGVDPRTMVWATMETTKGGIEVSSAQLMEHLKAHGSLRKVVKAIQIAQESGIELDFVTAARLDLLGRDVERELQIAAGAKARMVVESELARNQPS